MSTTDGPKREAIIYAYLRTFLSLELKTADLDILHRAFGSIARSLRTMERSKAPGLWRVRFDFRPGSGRFVELENVIDYLKEKGVLTTEWDGEMNKLTFYPDEVHRKRDSAQLLDERIARAYQFSPADAAFLASLCRSAVGLYKGIRSSSCY